MAAIQTMLEAAEAELTSAQKVLSEIDRALIAVNGKLQELDSQRVASLGDVAAADVLKAAAARGALSVDVATATMAKQELERRASIERVRVKAAGDRVSMLRFEDAERGLMVNLAGILKGPLPVLLAALEGFQLKADAIATETGLTPLVLFPSHFTALVRNQLEVVTAELKARRPDLVG